MSNRIRRVQREEGLETSGSAEIKYNYIYSNGIISGINFIEYNDVVFSGNDVYQQVIDYVYSVFGHPKVGELFKVPERDGYVVRVFWETIENEEFV